MATGSAHCLPYNEVEFIAALEQLEADGFTHIIYHAWLYADPLVQNSFWNVPAAYHDEYVKVYRLRDMRLSCEAPPIDIPHVNRFLQSPWAIPVDRSFIVSIHQRDSLDAKLVNYLHSLFSDWDNSLLLFDSGDFDLRRAGFPATNLDEITERAQIIYLLYNSLATTPSAQANPLPFDRFNLCQRQGHIDGSVMERYASRDYDCELFESSKAFPVEYDSGLRLENLVLDINPTSIDVQFSWSNFPPERHSVALQVFNSAGTKVHGQDATIRNRSLARQKLDISTLEPGEYVVYLIVYNYVTRVDEPGVRSGDGFRFERMLEIATFERS